MAASVHVVADEDESARCVLRDVKAVLAERFQVEHATVQVDVIGDEACPACEPASEAELHP